MTTEGRSPDAWVEDDAPAVLAARIAGKAVSVVEDVLLPGSLVRGYLRERERSRIAFDAKPQKIIRWAPDVILSFRIQKNTFTRTQYATVRNCFKQATREWEEICGVKFVYRKDLDSRGTSAKGALFTVRMFDLSTGDVASLPAAAAFFPSSSAKSRYVAVGPSYFDRQSRLDKVGIFRHEIGHVLGFRHEHVVLGAPVEGAERLNTLRQLSVYDRESVMHYPMGKEGGSTKFEFSKTDKKDAERVYGLPLYQVTFVH